MGAGGGRWRHLVAVADRGPGESYLPDDRPPSIFGPHQPGIATLHLDHVAFSALDVTVTGLAQLRELFSIWSAEAERLMSSQHAQASDRPGTGLTVSFGLPGTGRGWRRGTASVGTRRPAGLRELPAFPGDGLMPGICGGDVCVQVCAREPAATRDALDRLRVIARGLSLTEQERVIGRHRDAGAPLGRRHEFERLSLADTDASGEPVIALTPTFGSPRPRATAGVAMLRRSYSYDNGTGTGTLERDAGLLLLAYQRDPRRQSVPLQRKLAECDALSAFALHVGSGVFAIRQALGPGASPLSRCSRLAAPRSRRDDPDRIRWPRGGRTESRRST